MLARIIIETNRYAQAPLPPRRANQTVWEFDPWDVVHDVEPWADVEPSIIEDHKRLESLDQGLLRRPCKEPMKEDPVLVEATVWTKGGPLWYDITLVELWGWFGILIYMGTKREPIRRNYWRNYELLQCQIIPKVMTCKRWKAILRCLHLVHNSQIVRDTKHPQYDKIVKTWWFIDAWMKHSKELYNHEDRITVDELFIPYKDKYCNIW